MPRAKSALKRVCVVQPFLSNYSLPVFLELARYCEVDLFFSPAPKSSGFVEPALSAAPNVRYFAAATLKPFGDRLGMFQRGLLSYIFRQRPDALFLSANLRDLSFWGAVLCGRLLGIPVYAHGHGPFKRKSIGSAYRGMMQTLLRLLTSYICYAPAVRQSFVDFGFDEEKLTVAHNSLINARPVRPEEKTGGERGILFLGRLRADSHLEWLIHAVARLRDADRLPLGLHVIGAGEEEARLREEMRECPWVSFYGAVYDAEKIREASLHCFLGCYPGNAGLSLVHMMSLSLPVVTHDDLHAHGPEASFIHDGVSGLLYDRDDSESLYRALRSLACDPARVAEMRQNAFAEYQNLSNPSLAERFWEILRKREKPLHTTVAEQAPSSPRLSSGAHTGAGRP